MHVDGANRDADVAGDVADGGRSVPVVGEPLGGGDKDAPARLILDTHTRSELCLGHDAPSPLLHE